jgi:hypothetical protein
VDPAVKALRQLPVVWFLHELHDGPRRPIRLARGLRQPEGPATNPGPRLQQRRNTDKDADRTLATRSLDRHAPRIKAGRAVFLIGAVMLLIHDDQPQIGAGYEDAPPPTASEAVTGRHRQPPRSSFGIRLAAVETDAIGKGLLEFVQDPRSVVHLWDHHDRGAGRSPRRANQLGDEPSVVVP